jgi:hypothetical protein
MGPSMPIPVTDVGDEEVEKLLGIEESHFVDLKSKEIAPAKVTRSVSAFANASGGELFIGVEEHIGAEGQERVWRGFGDQEDANGLDHRSLIIYTIIISSILYFQRNTTGAALISSKY